MDYVDVYERYRQIQSRWQDMGLMMGLLIKKAENKRKGMTLAELDAMEDVMMQNG